MPEPATGEVAEVFVVVSGNVDETRSLACFAKKLLDDVIVSLAPVPFALHAPAVDDIADEVEIFRLGMLEKIEQQVRLRTARTEMNVGYPDGTEIQDIDDGRIH